MDESANEVAAVKDAVRHNWARRAATFDDAPNHGLHNAAQADAWLIRLQRWAGPTASDALDVGCGTGFLALQLATLGHRVVGIDAAQEMLALAQSKATRDGVDDIAFHQADAEHLPYDSRSFDLVVERHVLWTITQPVAALVEWRRVLRSGGRLLLIEGDWRGPGHADYAPLREHLPLFGGRPASVLADIAASAGFLEVHAEPLMDAALWGAEPDRERYALLGRAPKS
jgi:ubiquinone/menaquinone biosynthesis C-methylase UbiE